MDIALVTGASSGIGEQFVRQLIRERSSFGSVPFEEIWLVARRQDRLLSLKEELDAKRIRVFSLDLGDPSSITSLTEALAEAKPSIGLLVNCAGVGQTGAFEENEIFAISSIVSVNCSALAQITSICLPYMIPTGDVCTYSTGPRIINVASSAGFIPQPNFAVYAASKAFVISLSRALHAELRVHNIAVTTVCPGPVDTDFISVASGVPGKKTSGFKGLFTVHADRLVRKSILATKKGRGLYVYGWSQKALHVLSKILPTALFTFVMTRRTKNSERTEFSPVSEDKAIDSPSETTLPEVIQTSPKAIDIEKVVAIDMTGASETNAMEASPSPIIEPQNTGKTDVSEKILSKYTVK